MWRMLPWGSERRLREGAERSAGEVTSADDDDADGPSWLGFCKRLLTSNLGGLAVEAEPEAAIEVEGAVEGEAATEWGLPVENEVVLERAFPFKVEVAQSRTTLSP